MEEINTYYDEMHLTPMSTESEKVPIMVTNGKLFFWIKNTPIEIYLMWFLLIATIILVLCLVMTNVEDRQETERVL